MIIIKSLLFLFVYIIFVSSKNANLKNSKIRSTEKDPDLPVDRTGLKDLTRFQLYLFNDLWLSGKCDKGVCYDMDFD